MAFVEAITCKLFHQVKNFIGFFGADVLFGRTLTKDRAVIGHFFGLLFAHGAAQQVSAAQRIATQDLRCLHHLLLVDKDAVGFSQHLS